MPAEEKVILTTATFYQDPTGKDIVRFRLACKLVELAVSEGHIVVIIDDSPNPEVRKTLKDKGALVFAQSEKGMGFGRRQVWRAAEELTDSRTNAVIWTEPEKPDIVRSIHKMVLAMRERGAAVVIPSRSTQSWETYPAFQRESEQVGNLVYNNVFFRSNEPLDPMFGPLCIKPNELSYFACFSLNGLPDSNYLQHYVPPFMMSLGLKVCSIEVDFTYPPEQRAEEETTKLAEMLEKRLKQLHLITATYFELHRRYFVR